MIVCVRVHSPWTIADGFFGLLLKLICYYGLWAIDHGLN
ncbi:MAG: hypothetical protein JWP94_2535 [Mucilaginibacter sp.]|nr:hypothetical protein [Mucilaginibacter sp.]